MANDFIKLPRSAITDIWRDKDLCQLYCYLLDKCDENGVAMISFRSAAMELHMSLQTFRTLLNKLKLTQKVTQQLTQKVTQITICKSTNKSNRVTQQLTQKVTQQLTHLTAQADTPKYPYVDPQFMDAWESWMEYRRETKRPYKNLRQEKIGYKQLLEMSDNNPEEATRLVERTIANGWQGLHREHNNYYNGARFNSSSDKSTDAKEKRDRGLSLATTIVSQSENLLNLYNGGQPNSDAGQNQT